MTPYNFLLNLQKITETTKKSWIKSDDMTWRTIRPKLARFLNENSSNIVFREIVKHIGPSALRASGTNLHLFNLDSQTLVTGWLPVTWGEQKCDIGWGNWMGQGHYVLNCCGALVKTQRLMARHRIDS